jgi:hypothetical protein
MRGSFGLGVESQVDDLGHLVVGELPRPSPSRANFAEALETFGGKAAAPLDDRDRSGAELVGDGVIGLALRRQQNDAGSGCQPLESTKPVQPPQSATKVVSRVSGWTLMVGSRKTRNLRQAPLSQD